MKSVLIFLLVLFLATGLGGQPVHADKSVNPSFYYTTEELKALKELETAPSHSALWNNIQSWANAHLGDTPAARSDNRADLTVKIFIETMVFMYNMTDDTTYADAAVNWMLSVSDWEDWYAEGSTSTVSRCYLCLGVGCGYYALHDYMDSKDRTTVKNKLIEQAGWLYTNYPAPTPDYSYSAHGIVIGTGVGIAALALGSDYEDSSKWLEYSYTFIDFVLNGMGINDGGWIEGPNYYTVGMCALIPYCDALRRVAGKDYFALNNDFFSNTGYYAIYMTIVNSEYGQGKIQMEDTTGSSPWNDDVTVDFTYKLANEYHDGYVQTFANSYAEQDSAMSYIWKEPDLTPLAYDDLPLHRTFDDIGYEIWRESWDNNSLVFLFKSGRSYNHAHPDQNTYAIYKNGEALTTGIGYASSWQEYKNTLFNNCLTTGDYHGNDGKLYGYGQAHEPNDIGGAIVPIGTSGHILSTDYTETYFYVAGDASALYTGQVYPETLDWPLYSSGSLEKWVRHVVFLPDSQYFVMYDDIVSPIAQQVNWWYRAADLFNDDGTDAPPSLTINDDLITQVIGNNRLEIKMLEPSSGSFSYTIDSNTGLYYSEFSYILLWPETNTTTPKFLSVMTVDGRLSTRSLQATRVQQGNCLGVMVDDGKYRDLILFSTDGEPVEQYIELGDYYKSADGNSYTFNGTQVHVNFNAYKVIRLETLAENRAPMLASIGDKSITEGNTLQFTISATDPDNDPVFYSASNLPSGASFNPATRTFSWTPSESQIGNYANVHFEVTDGKLTQTEDITITVVESNSPRHLSNTWWFWLTVGLVITVIVVVIIWRRAGSTNT
jgi:hypothetical protein